MDLTNLGLFRLVAKKMDYLAQRQGVIAENIANVDTPDYRPNDLVPFDFRTALAERQSLPTATTHAAHLGGRVRDPGPGARRQEQRPYETKPDGNSVVLEEQMLKMAADQADHKLVTNLYRKNLSMIMMALSGGGGGR